MSYISLEDCKHGYTYKISSRNLSIGVFNENDNGFIGIREKFGSEYLFTEYHWDTGAPFGTVNPKEEIEKCPCQEIKESLGTYCGTCRKDVQWEEGTSWQDKRRIHKEKDNCEKLSPCVKWNQEMFDYLKELEKKR